MSSEQDQTPRRHPPPQIADFLEHPTRRLEDWHWLFREDQAFPVRSHRGFLGKLVVLFKRLFRPLVAVPQNDLWERQRVFNLILLEHLLRAEEREAERESRIDSLEASLGNRMSHVEAVIGEGLNDLMRHSDALYGRVDRKLDRYRRETQQLLSHLGSALARADSEGSSVPVARAVEELDYLGFEEKFRGTEEEILGRVREYLPRLQGKGPVLDLGCGRGEALAALGAAGIEARGVDTSAEMVARCRAQGLSASEQDLFEALAVQPPESLGAVVSFHVIEHLPPELLRRLLRLAWGALRPGGLLVLETPNPLSVVVAARNFWLDPTHRRPVHPDFLISAARQVGFDPVERLDLRPFGAEQRLPELLLDGLPAESARMADAVNRLRDRLDDLLFGFQDYALLAEKPAPAR